METTDSSIILATLSRWRPYVQAMRTRNTTFLDREGGRGIEERDVSRVYMRRVTAQYGSGAG